MVVYLCCNDAQTLILLKMETFKNQKIKICSQYSDKFCNLCIELNTFMNSLYIIPFDSFTYKGTKSEAFFIAKFNKKKSLQIGTNLFLIQ